MKGLMRRVVAAAAAGMLAGGVVAVAGPGVAGAADGSHGGGGPGTGAWHALGPAHRAPGRRPRVSAPLLRGAGSAGPAAVTFAHTYTVDTTSDLPWASGACASGNSDTCSLRAAVTQANTDNALDKIVLPAGSYPLQTGELVITDTAGVYIDGGGPATTTVAADSSSADYPFRVFQVTDGAQATILGLRIEDGYSSASAGGSPEDGYGGGIEVLDGTLNLRNSSVTANKSDHDGAGIYLAGQDSISGGVQSQAYLRDDTISGNTALGSGGIADGSGGGIDDEGQAQADHVTVTGNTANDSGGGIAMNYAGSYGPSLEGTAVTVTGNSSPFGGGIQNSGTLELTGSQVGTASTPNTAEDGGGINSSDMARLNSTAVVGNTASAAGAGVDSGGQFTMTGGSITGNGPAPSASPFGGGLFAGEYSSTVLSKVAVSGNAAYTGGGIYEYENHTSVTVTGGSVSGNTATTDGGGIYAGSALTMTGGKITGNTAAGDGGGIWDEGTLSLSRVQVGTAAAPNAATAGDGGGIYTQDSLGTISHTTIAGNTAANGGSGDGGGLYTFEAEMAVTASTVSANSADGVGGGIYNQGYDLHITGSAISANTAAVSGGGIDNEDGLTMTNDTVAVNQAGTSSTPGSGAGIDNDASANATLTNLTVSGNGAGSSGDGGALYNAGTMHLKGTILAGNTAAAGQANCGGPAPVTSAGYNLEDDTSCPLSGPGDLTSTNPQLATLASNGGPTQTEAIPATSPAVDADSSCPPPATDQRGVKRGQPCDIGAYENPGK